MTVPIDVVMIWHMHQPYYKDPLKNEYALPWTYLHAIKDYFDMPAIIEDTDGAKAVFNLVPSLLEQITDYAAGTAVDPFLEKGKAAPADLAEGERTFLLENFFSANRQRMIEISPRYLELLYMAGEGKPGSARERVKHFCNQDLLDLQVLFFLAWTGEAARRRYPLLTELLAKGSDFTPEDKEQLFRTHQELLKAIIPLYKRLHLEGRIELAVSPYFHPILPLLSDTRIAQSAMPRITLPKKVLLSPEDANAQVVRGIEYFQELFGFAPKGIWPSEGSVSNQTLEIIASNSIKWIATDEDILANSLPGGLGERKQNLYKPCCFASEGGDLAIFFRDHQLSDLLGFTYSQWDTKHAITDFCDRLKNIKGAESIENRVITICLDGENAWEYYPNNGYDFLQGLYRTVAKSPFFNLTTCSEFLEKPTSEFKIRLAEIHPGSWINANYGIWIGHPEENLAWELLAAARTTAVQNRDVAKALGSGTPSDNKTIELICRSLYAAEGSDWFWWYGDDHFSPHSDYFDRLFRQHLINVYTLLEVAPPHKLFEAIKKTSPAGLVREPAGFIYPETSGRASGYFEWLAAGLYDLTRQGSAMHSSETLLQSFYYGYNSQYLFFRMDSIHDFSTVLSMMDLLHLHIIYNREYRLTLQLSKDEGFLQVKENAVWTPTFSYGYWKIDKICEISIPLEIFKLEPGSKLFVYVSLMRDNQEIGRWPADAPMMLYYAGEQIELDNWLI